MSGKQKWLFAALVALGILSIAGIAFANTIYLPVVYKDPTITPSFTPTFTLTPTVTRTPTATPTATPEPGVYIVDIEYNSDDESLEEYIEIENTSDDDVDMTGWFIKAETGEKYTFPDDYTLREDGSVRVWSRIGTNTSTNLYWGRAEPVWDEKGNIAYLKDDESNLIDTYSY